MIRRCGVLATAIVALVVVAGCSTPVAPEPPNPPAPGGSTVVFDVTINGPPTRIRLRTFGLDGPGGWAETEDVRVGTPVHRALPFTRTVSPRVAALADPDPMPTAQATINCTITVDGRVVLYRENVHDSCAYSEDPNYLSLLGRLAGFGDFGDNN